MTDREKVIKGLECCSRVEPEVCERMSCPYVNEHRKPGRIETSCMDQLMRDALALLQAQEPRVLSLEEAKSVEGYVWLECCDTPILRVSLFHDGYYIEPFEEPFRVDLMNWPDYNKEWRYWTSCPTDEQREAVKWE